MQRKKVEGRDWSDGKSKRIKKKRYIKRRRSVIKRGGK